MSEAKKRTSVRGLTESEDSVAFEYVNKQVAKEMAGFYAAFNIPAPQESKAESSVLKKRTSSKR